MAYAAALIHECFHGFVALMLGIKPTGIKVHIFGIKLTLPYVVNSTDKILIWLAGPVASFSFGLFFYVMGDLFSVNSGAYSFFVFANFAIGAINLLPVFPLDGGAVLKAVFTRYFGIIKGAKRIHFAQNIVCVILGGICIILCICKIFNPSIWGIFLFLLLNKNKEKYQSISEKKTVLSGDIPLGPKLKYIACHGESELLCLAECISPDYTLVVAAFCNERFVGDLCQADIIEGINKYGALCTAGQYIQQRQNKYFSE